MKLPKFILGDNTDLPNAIFVIHTEFPRFVINLDNDEVDWFEDFDAEDQNESYHRTLAQKFKIWELPLVKFKNFKHHHNEWLYGSCRLTKIGKWLC
mgnify:CR=1 FL=1